MLAVKNLPANAGDLRKVGSIPGPGRSPGRGNGNLLQYSCLENWWTEEPFGLHPSGMTEHACMHAPTSFKPTGSFLSVQFSSVTQSCPTLHDPMNYSTPGLPVHYQLLEFTQTHVHRVCDSTQLSHPLSSPSPPTSNLSQHQGLFQWVRSLHQVAKVLEFQLQHHSFQWTPRTDFL